ncbi:MAG: competence/damage-inducible protein A [Actinomycetota bacterium]|nr:competence/damage-inducible protein A [Actinomycetota bacterium]
MRCDVVAVGTELLLGQIVDTNSSYLGEQLALRGIDSLLQVKVGDNLDRMVAVLRARLEEADAVIVCGGLGPTHDDITREAIAVVMGVELEEDAEVAERIIVMFESRGRRMPMNNLRQAMVPVGATVIAQTMGTAPGLICPVGGSGGGDDGHDDKVIYAVPGVPYELHDMVERAVLPDLARRAGLASVIASRVIKTWGDSESGINERLDDIITELEGAAGPTLAFLASGWDGLKIRLTVRATDAETAEDQLGTWERRVVERLGSIVFGRDDETMESVVLDLLRRRGMRLALAESVTGGLVAGRLTDVAGSSDVLVGSIVSYASSVKRNMLGVPEGPVVSAEAATAMADNVRGVLGADVGLALTGVAGPAEQDGLPPGTLWVGVAIGDEVESHLVRLPGDRLRMRQFSVITALDALRRRLLTIPEPVPPTVR